LKFSNLLELHNFQSPNIQTIMLNIVRVKAPSVELYAVVL
jgi:hypothetical protein